MSFHEIVTEADPSSWHLDQFVDADGAAIDLTLFTLSQTLQWTSPLRCKVSIEGRETDLTFTAFGVPITIRALSQQLMALAPHDLQMLPLIVEGSPNSFDVVNVLPRLHALDDDRSIGGRWPTGSPSAGQWLYVLHAALKSQAVHGHSLFRVHGWLPPIFCTEAVRAVLEPQEWTGLQFRPTLAAA